MKGALVEQVALARWRLVMLERVVDEVLPAFGEHHTIHLGVCMAARQGHVLRHLRHSAAECAERPLQPAVLVDDRLLPGKVPYARVPILQVHHPQEGALADHDFRAAAMEAAGRARGSAAAGRFGEERGLGAFTEHDEHVRGIDATRADRRHDRQRFTNLHAGRHVEHGARPVKRRVQRREPVGARIDHREPVGLDRGAAFGKHPLGRTEHHALCGERGITLLVEHVPVERHEPAGQGGVGRRLAGLVEDRVCRYDARGDRLSEEAGRSGCGRSRRPQAPGLGLEEPQVGPHPVFTTAVGQPEAGEGGKGGAAFVAHPGRHRLGGDQVFEGVPVESRRRGGGSGGSGHRQPTDPSICSWMSLFISTAYSIGSSFTSGSMNPPTIIVLASASESPRLMR